MDIFQPSALSQLLREFHIEDNDLKAYANPEHKAEVVGFIREIHKTLIHDYNDAFMPWFNVPGKQGELFKRGVELVKALGEYTQDAENLDSASLALLHEWADAMNLALPLSGQVYDGREDYVEEEFSKAEKIRKALDEMRTKRPALEQPALGSSLNTHPEAAHVEDAYADALLEKFAPRNKEVGIQRRIAGIEVALEAKKNMGRMLTEPAKKGILLLAGLFDELKAIPENPEPTLADKRMGLIVFLEESLDVKEKVLRSGLEQMTRGGMTDAFLQLFAEAESEEINARTARWEHVRELLDREGNQSEADAKGENMSSYSDERRSLMRLVADRFVRGFDVRGEDAEAIIKLLENILHVRDGGAHRDEYGHPESLVKYSRGS